MSDINTDSTDASSNYSYDLKTYEQGLDDGIEKLLETLRMFGEAACIVLDMLPSDQFSFAFKVSDKCNLEFTVKKV